MAPLVRWAVLLSALLPTASLVPLSVAPPGQQQVATLAIKNHLTKIANIENNNNNSAITNVIMAIKRDTNHGKIIKNAGTSQFMTTMATKLVDKNFAAEHS